MKRNGAGKREQAAPARTNTLPDYGVYHLSMRQRMGCIILGGLIFFSIGYLFYHNLILSLLLGTAGLTTPKFWRRFMLERRRKTLNLHFKQALYSLSSSLSAGRSVENGFRDAVQDLLLLDPGGTSDLIFELKVIVSRMEYGEPIEVALQDFARRAGMEDMDNFADVFSTCKRTGGDLVEVVRRTSSVIGEKLDIQQEISVMIAQKRFESKALLAAPFLLLLFMNLTSPDYMETMYSGPGIMISTFALAALGGCFLWISKMMNIKV
ncbi:type II secretion system F family protein [Paenibacillus lautus]|uniref:type II secretion system F family protein n=1 Tax=Paenibacillus lautus TaxID=1401 RepID=UPI001C7DD6A2|nr:type II secretion system F family protein [Paenibacillus lautus]MBX4146403.1 type II secretion system F family protein [Paenibacillus lautus]